MFPSTCVVECLQQKPEPRVSYVRTVNNTCSSPDRVTLKDAACLIVFRLTDSEDDTRSTQKLFFVKEQFTKKSELCHLVLPPCWSEIRL